MNEGKIVLQRLKDTLDVLKGNKVVTRIDFQIRDMIEDCIEVIDKQQKEIGKLQLKNEELLRKLKNRVKENKKLIKYSNYKKEFSTLNKQIDKQNKVMDEMIKWIDDRCFYLDDCGNHCEIIEDSCYDITKNWNCKDCIKQYFIRKVEEDGK